MTARIGETLRERFCRQIMHDQNSGCWLWTGAAMPKGYGAISAIGLPKKTLLAHRVSYELHVGNIPPGMCVLHKCDTTPCVNPAHLFLGTHKDNALDKIKKGRGVDNRGSRHGMAKLSENDIVAIRLSTELQRVVAKRYGVANTIVSRIKNRSIWRHVP